MSPLRNGVEVVTAKPNNTPDEPLKRGETHLPLFLSRVKRLSRGRIRRVLNVILRFEEWLLGEHIPDDWTRVDYTFVAEKLIEAFPFAKKIYLSDRYFYLCPKQDIIDFLAQDITDKRQYLTEIFDCDDFAFRLMGQFHTMPYSALAIGIAWSRVHAYNTVVIDNEQNVWIIEPQTDALIRPEDAEKEYETELVWM